jgi:tetraacyldisaccharide-1-P 4'-kinase
MVRKIAFINYKGGVGKTSCIVNIASSLVQKGNRVLSSRSRRAVQFKHLADAGGALE